MEQEVLNGVGKKLRNSYLRGEVSDSKVMEVYRHYKKEADAFSSFSMTERDLKMALQGCHNPVLKAKIEECLLDRVARSKKSGDQNKLSLEKLENFKKEAIEGMGLRKVISKMKKAAKRSSDLDLHVVTLLLETEFANLSAKKNGKRYKAVIYERKTILLEDLAYLLEGTNWKFGYNDNSGKNANYLVYIYLPNGEQLSWHCNEYDTVNCFPYIDSMWDGKVCSTLDKILNYIGNNYSEILQAA